jgi:hypothetical protein
MQIIEDLSPFYRNLMLLKDIIQGERQLEYPSHLFDGLTSEQFQDFQATTQV